MLTRTLRRIRSRCQLKISTWMQFWMNTLIVATARSSFIGPVYAGPKFRSDMWAPGVIPSPPAPPSLEPAWPQSFHLCLKGHQRWPCGAKRDMIPCCLSDQQQMSNTGIFKRVTRIVSNMSPLERETIPGRIQHDGKLDFQRVHLSKLCFLDEMLDSHLTVREYFGNC